MGRVLSAEDHVLLHADSLSQQPSKSYATIVCISLLKDAVHPCCQVVYDASALVRSELAVALARLVRGHMPLLEDAIMQLRVSWHHAWLVIWL